MKKTILLLVAFISIVSLTNAQEGINYQAVVRDDNGDLMKNEAVDLEFNVIKTSTSGTVVYTETHALSTNNFGNIVAIIGQGTPTIGLFTDIDWASDKNFLNVKVNTVDMGTTEFLSVPLAIHAKTATEAQTADHALTADELTSPIWTKNPTYPGSAFTNLTPRVSKSSFATGLSVLELTRYSLGIFPNPGSLDTVFLVEKYGEVQRPEISGDADMLPLAYGTIGSTGLINKATKNVLTVTNVSSGVYTVVIDGETANGSDFVVLATSYDNSGGEIIDWSVTGGEFRFIVTNSSGNNINSIFSFIIYKP